MADMSLIEIAVLALIQGAAELLPVSSSAHVILAERLMGYKDPSTPELTFLLVMLHTGTMLAVLFYFWPRWRALLFGASGPAGSPRLTSSGIQFLKMVVLATAVTGLVGLGLLYLIEKVILIGLLGRSKGEVEDLFKELPLIAASLFAVGLLIIAAGSRRPGATEKLTAGSSFWIGAIQGLCLPFRGFSRSGSTISVALFGGIARPLAEDFSFALAVVLTPPVIGRSVYRLLRDRSGESSAGLAHLLLPGLVGMVFSFLAGLAALRVLSVALERGRWRYFGYYCLAAAAVVLAAALAGV